MTNCYDNAAIERFFWSLKHEWANRETFRNLADARLGVFRYIETFYNPERLHQTLGNLTQSIRSRTRPGVSGVNYLPPVSENPGSSHDSMSESNPTAEPTLFPQEEWITSRAVERCTCYRREDGEIVRHGKYQFVDSGRITEEGEVRNGWREGVWQSYHENGRIKSISEYRRGAIHGLYKEWYDTGVLRFEWTMDDGHSHGAHRSYHPNGNLNEEAMYEHDFKNGRCQVWDENGVLLADGIYEWDNPVDGTFIIDEIIDPGPKLATFGQYMDAFLNRRRAVVEFRNGEPISGQRLPPRL